MVVRRSRDGLNLTSGAEYDANTLELDAIVEITPTAPVTIRGIDCVELRTREWLAPRDWARSKSIGK